MKTKLLLHFLILILFANFSFSQNTPIPNGSFNVASDINNWTVVPNNVTKSWFSGGCQAMFVDNLGNSQDATITSPIFAIAATGDYQFEFDYGLVFSSLPVTFELVGSNGTAFYSPSIETTIPGNCTDWPNSTNNVSVFTNVIAGNYQVRITIPGSQFFLDGAGLGGNNPVTISGAVNASGCSNPNMVNNYPIKITDLATNYTFYTATVNGNYSFVLNNPSGNFLIEPVDNGNIATTPNNIALTINSLSNTYLNNDFCLSSILSGVDVQTQLIPYGLARPGFVANYNLIYSNNGDTTTGNETIVLNYDDTKMMFQGASVAPASTTINSVTWNYSNLTPLEIRNIELSFNVLTPPTVNSGDILNFTGYITPQADTVPLNNYIYLDQTVVNAYDPNDAFCLEGTEIAPSQIGDDLTYRIRFQNTGTASAVNITVKTDLDADLDWSTFQPLTASHAFTNSLVNGNELTYTFSNINLPDSATDPVGSNGWFFYKIKPKSTVVVGDSFDATADIFFDFNAAIVTNTYTTTIVVPTVSETYVPDDNFENHLETHNYIGDVVPLGDPTSMGNGIANDDYVTTANINTVEYLFMPSLGITDLTGIEDFVAIKNLQIPSNQLTTVDVSQNTALELFYCSVNQLTSLDVSANTALIYLNCFSNQLTTLDVSTNLALQDLACGVNLITDLNLSLNTNLNRLVATNGQLATLNVKNGNNTNFILFNAISNPNLTCIEVDDAAWSDANWFNKDTTSSFDENCSITNQDAYEPNQNFAESVDINLCTSINPTIGELGDVDFFTIPLEANLNTELKVENVPTGLTYKVTFYTDTQAPLGTSFLVTDTQPLTQYFFTIVNSFFYVKIESDNADYSVIPYTLTVSNPNCTLSVSEFLDDTFRVFPNPVKDELTISIQSEATFSLLSVNGQVLRQGSLQLGESTLSMSNLSNGLYFIQVETKKGISTKKIIKQ